AGSDGTVNFWQSCGTEIYTRGVRYQPVPAAMVQLISGSPAAQKYTQGAEESKQIYGLLVLKIVLNHTLKFYPTRRINFYIRTRARI
ncbi:7957_t:CDS:1, partial [Paraglomus occultum]